MHKQADVYKRWEHQCAHASENEKKVMVHTVETLWYHHPFVLYGKLFFMIL